MTVARHGKRRGGGIRGGISTDTTTTFILQRCWMHFPLVNKGISTLGTTSFQFNPFSQQTTIFDNNTYIYLFF